MKPTKAQREVLKRMREGDTLLEFLVPKKPFFRTLGKTVPCELRYILGLNGNSEKVKVVPYATFWCLFKRNLIQPSNYNPNPKTNPKTVGQFYLTDLGYKLS